jgi:UDP-N-acetylmuramyl pentapeptide phosphotransferase/UDP-N-acetylglucosamine-1-phosphate transferase
MNQSSLFILFYTVITVFCVSALLTRWLAQTDRLRILDYPNARSLHRHPTPRTGGLAIFSTVIGATIWIIISTQPAISPSQIHFMLWFGLAFMLVAGTAFGDDCWGIPRRYRLSAQIIAALILVFKGQLLWHASWLPSWIDVPYVVAVILTLLFIVWMINLFNFMDGLDGLAGGMASCGFATLALFGWQQEAWLFTALTACLAAAALGFLTSNFPPARIFLGDVGSASLGLCVAVFSLWGAQADLLPFWAAGLIFSPFIVDATWTLLLRLWQREVIWDAHCSHHYQLFVLAGWPHRTLILRAYLLMISAACCALAIPQLTRQEQWWLFAMWGIIYSLIHWRARYCRVL